MRLNRRILCIGSLRATATDGLPVLERRDARAKRFDHPGERGAGDVRKGFRHYRSHATLADVAIHRQNPGGINANEQLARLWLWARNLLQLELFGPTICMNADRLHSVC